METLLKINELQAKADLHIAEARKYANLSQSNIDAADKIMKEINDLLKS